jgi:hypothetical protein
MIEDLGCSILSNIFDVQLVDICVSDMPDITISSKKNQDILRLVIRITSKLSSLNDFIVNITPHTLVNMSGFKQKLCRL